MDEKEKSDLIARIADAVIKKIEEKEKIDLIAGIVIKRINDQTKKPEGGNNPFNLNEQ